MAGTLLVSKMHVPTDMVSGAHLREHDVWHIDGCRVTRQLYEFCNALRKQHAFKHCLFGVNNEWNAEQANESVWVYSPDEIFARGSIGHGDVGVNALLYKYYVETEQIRNYKVKINRRQYNMVSSEKVDRMIIASKKHLRPYPLEKIVNLTAYKLTTSLSQEKDATNKAEDAAMCVMQAMLSRNGVLTAELANMVKTDYVFKDESVKDAIVAYMDTIDDDIEVSSRNISIALVLVHPPHAEGADHAVTVQRGLKHLNLRSRVYTSDVENSFDGAIVERFTPDTLPDDIRQKVSSLNILDANSYVDGLGLRQSENIYYIAEDA
jgi:hypothetical protein